MFVTLFLFSLFSSYWLSGKVLVIAKNYKILDNPSSNPDRKKQANPVPLLGGLGFSFVAGFLSLGLILARDQNWFGLSYRLTQNILSDFNFFGILIGGLLIILFGFLDDKYNLDSRLMLFTVNLSIIITVVFGGLQVTNLSYPFDTLLPNFPFLHYFLAYIWILLCISATKFLDGHDGLSLLLLVFFLMLISL
jgi:UDP-N-acetylmuramyl pentapeptide phosphotransferase/UDP-N-acetylglucosamine-1-phosphate transferase